MNFQFFISLLLICVLTTNAKSPLLLISLDGMRSDKFEDFLQENPSCNFNRIIKNGLKADYMIPAFPSQTFPNHWTIVTGVYPEVHGIVGNTIYDPSANMIVDLQVDPNTKDPRWWNRTDPIWLTVRNKGLKTGVSFWPGSEVWTRNPDIYLSYNSNWSFKSRIDEMIDWFDKFELDLVCFYFNEPDYTGHAFGPDSQQYKDKIKEMDGYIGYMLDSLENIKLLDNLNVILLSDHGMSKSVSRPILIQNYVDANLIDFNKTVLAYASNIYPNDMSKLSELYNALQNLPNSTTYYKKDVPERFHYSNSDRIGPIVVITNEGYELTNDPDRISKTGLHGFDNSLTTMRAIFTASGPNFKKNQKITPFENVNVQPLICKLLDIDSKQSNGSVSIFESYLSLDSSTLSNSTNAPITSSTHNSSPTNRLTKTASFMLALISTIVYYLENSL